MNGTNDPAVYLPTNLNYLLSVYRSRPNAVLVAGGTHIMCNSNRKVPQIGDRIIYLGRVDELNRMTRSDRHLDIGCCVSLQKMIDFSSSVLPHALISCIQSVGPLSLRQAASIGGNICVAPGYLGCLPALQLLDARAEVRSTGSSRWLPMGRLFDDDVILTLDQGEIITRIRIPSDRPQISVYRTAGDKALSFTGFADPQTDSLADIRFAFGLPGHPVIRVREVEAELIGRKLPLSDRDLRSASLLLSQSIHSETSPFEPHLDGCAQRLLSWFLQLLVPTDSFD